MDKSEDKPSTSSSATPMTGGITSKDEAPNQDKDIFDTKGGEPVRDRKPDESKGQPVTRFFTKDGTPVEPSTIPQKPGGEVNLEGRPDVVAVTEYLDEQGNTVTHDSLKAKKSDK